MKNLLFLSIVTALACPAQDMERVFELKYSDPRDITMLLSVYPVKVGPITSLPVISVHGSKESIATIAEMLKTIDVPRALRKDVEITGYVLLASPAQPQGVEPAELAGPIKQLRALFPYKSYNVAETILLRARDGQGASSGGMLGLDQNTHWRYEFNCRPAISTSEKIIRLENLSLLIHSPSGVIQLRTDVDIRDGQKVVVGKSNLTGGDTAMILVLTAKAAE
jgi:hypothetical protein